MPESSPSVIVIAGPNGAGKSTVAPLLLRDALKVREFVNADTIAQGLSAFGSEKVAMAAGRIMLARLRELAKQRVSFAFETTLASRSFVPWIGQLRADGYRFRLAFLWLPSDDLAVARVADRVRLGGHSVAENVIRRRYNRGLTNLFGSYTAIADLWRVYDASGGKRPRVIVQGSGPTVLRIWDHQIWHRIRSLSHE